MAAANLERGFIFCKTGLWGCWPAAGDRTMHHPSSSSCLGGHASPRAVRVQGIADHQADTSGFSAAGKSYHQLLLVFPSLCKTSKGRRESTRAPDWVILAIWGWGQERSEEEEEMNVIKK